MHPKAGVVATHVPATGGVLFSVPVKKHDFLMLTIEKIGPLARKRLGEGLQGVGLLLSPAGAGRISQRVE